MPLFFCIKQKVVSLLQSKCTTAKSHEKRAKIDKYTRVERSPDGLALTLSHPKWPKSWTVASDDAGQLRYWQRAFVAAGATSSDSSKSSGSSKGARNKRSNRSRAPNKEQRGGVPVVAGDAPTLPEMFVELPPTPPPDPVSSAVSAAEATRDDVPPPLPPDDDSDGSDGNVSRKNAPPPVDAAPPAPPEPISAAAPRAPAPLKVVPPSTQVPLSPAVPKSSGSGVKAAPAPTGAASPISPRVQRDSAATVKSLIERSKLPPGGIIMPKPLGPDLKSPRVSQSAKEPPSSPRGSAIAAAKAPVVAETPKSPRGSAVSKPAEPTPAKVAVVEPAAVESSPAAVAPASSVAAIGARPSREAPKRQVSTAVATNTIVAPASAVATPATAPVAAPVTTATPVVVDKPIDKPVDKSAEIVVSPLVSDDPTITSVTLDSKMLVQMSSDEHATYFKTSGNTDDMPNVRAPTRVRGDDAAFSVTKAKTIPVAVTVLGQSRPDQELCLSFVANGVKLKINKDWVLNGQEVRNESVDGGGKATLVTLFVAIKYFEPPVTRVFVTARVKNTTTQKRLVLDVVQKVRDAAAVKPIVVPLAAPATAAAAVSAASAAAAVAPLSPATVKRSPSVAASMGSVTLAMNALELALDNETHVFYLSLAAKANALPGWNVRTLKVAPAAKEPVFAVKIGTPFPVRVMVGDSTTQLSVALTMGDKKLKNGRDWRLHSQTRTGEGADTELLLDIIVANASCDVPVLISAGASGAKLDRSTLLFQLLPANSEAPLSPRSRTAAPPPAAATATAAAAAAAVPAASPPVTQRARNATAAVAVESPPVGRARTATASSVGPLPPGWAEARTADGRTYYFNRSLNKTTWVRPTASSGPTSTGAAPAVAAAAAQLWWRAAPATSEDSSSDDDATPLPPDWRAATNSAGRLYYFNVKTKATSWTSTAHRVRELVGAGGRRRPPTTGATHHFVIERAVRIEATACRDCQCAACSTGRLPCRRR
jgi:hypothetical protein